MRLKNVPAHRRDIIASALAIPLMPFAGLRPLHFAALHILTPPARAIRRRHTAADAQQTRAGRRHSHAPRFPRRAAQAGGEFISDAAISRRALPHAHMRLSGAAALA